MRPPARSCSLPTRPRSSGLSAPWRAPLPECFLVLDIIAAFAAIKENKPCPGLPNKHEKSSASAILNLQHPFEGGLGVAVFFGSFSSAVRRNERNK